MGFWIYLLCCADGSYYVGHTDNLEQRLAEHQGGTTDGYTATRRPVRLVHAEPFATRAKALSAEMRIKGWSRKKKEAWARGEWTEVSRLAQRRKPFRSKAPSG